MLGTMNTALLILGSIFVFLAAVIHLLIFFLESILWSKPSTWKRFGLKTQAEADIMKPMAFNQGFYNVFLAIGAGAGLVMLGSANWVQGGFAVAIFACVSMVLAAIVLIMSSPKLWRAALVQGVPPLLGIGFLLIPSFTG
jgi:putative membrane protein